jgi:hypothetical protein
MIPKQQHDQIFDSARNIVDVIGDVPENPRAKPFVPTKLSMDDVAIHVLATLIDTDRYPIEDFNDRALMADAERMMMSFMHTHSRIEIACGIGAFYHLCDELVNVDEPVKYITG